MDKKGLYSSQDVKIHSSVGLGGIVEIAVSVASISYAARLWDFQVYRVCVHRVVYNIPGASS